MSNIQESTRLSRWLTFSASNANSPGLYLKAQAPLVFPERCCHTRLHPRGLNLAGCVEALRKLARGHTLLATNAGKRQDRLPWAHRVRDALWPSGRRCQAAGITVLAAVVRGGILGRSGLQKWWLLVAIMRGYGLRRRCRARGGHVLLIIHLWPSCIHCLVLIVSRRWMASRPVDSVS